MTSMIIDRRDGLSSSTAIKGPCKAATTANIALYGHQVIDGIAVVTNDRVLVKDQTAPTENGIYTVDTGGWRRSADFRGNRDVRQGSRVSVNDGTVSAGFEFTVASADPIVIDQSSVLFEVAGVPFNIPAVVRDYLDVPTYVPTRTVLKALDPAKDPLAFLMQNGRYGLFRWIPGDFSAFVTADTNEGVYVKADSIAATSGAWVRQRTNLRVYPEWFGAVKDGATSDTTAFQKAADLAVAFGWDIGLSSGKYYLTSTVTISYASHTQFLNVENRTVNIIGEGSGNTQVVHSGFTGPAFDYQGKLISMSVTTKQGFSGFSISAATLGLGTGIKLDNLAYATFTDVSTFGLALHMDATDVLTTSFHGCIFLFGVEGLKFAHSNFSRPNAISFHGCSIAGMNERALEVVGGTAITFYGGTIENNGGFGVSPTRTAVLITNPNVEGGVAFAAYGLHVEANDGLADFLFNMSTTDPALIVFDGCNIQRGSGLKTTNNILIQQNTASTGKVTLVCRSSFRHFAGYTPTALEPAIRVISDPACEYDVDVSGSYFGHNLYRWQETTPTPHATVRFVGATASMISASNVETITRNGAGDYTINLRNALRGTSPIVTGAGAGVVGVLYLNSATTTSVRVGFFNFAGTAVDPTNVMAVIYDAA